MFFTQNNEVNNQVASNQKDKNPNAPLIVWAKRRNAWWPAIVV
jgi:hypothetical protein